MNVRLPLLSPYEISSEAKLTGRTKFTPFTMAEQINKKWVSVEQLILTLKRVNWGQKGMSFMAHLKFKKK